MNTLTASSATVADHPAFTAPPTVINVKARRRAPLPWKKWLVGAAAVIAVGAGVGSYVHYAAGFEATDDAFLEGNVHPISPRINGTVVRVLVDDNAHVEAGQPLVELDPADLKLAAQSAEADLAQTRSNAREVEAQIARARAEVDAADAHIAQNAAGLHRAELDFHRMETLVRADNGAVSQQTYDVARADYDAAQAAQKSAVSQRASAEASLAAAEAQRSVASAQVQKAEAALQIAKLQVEYTVIRAPSAGRVAKKNVETGQRLQPGQPILSVVDDQVWVVANFKESQLAQLRAGENVEVKVDAIDGAAFRGVVDSFSPGTGAKFALLPPDNSTGNFTKIVQRVPVKILLAPDSLGRAAPRLAPGLSAVVKVAVRE